MTRYLPPISRPIISTAGQSRRSRLRTWDRTSSARSESRDIAMLAFSQPSRVPASDIAELHIRVESEQA